MLVSDKWKQYQVLDAGEGEKLENWNGVILRRPDPEAIWPKRNVELWELPDAFYHRDKEGGGSWLFNKNLKDFWTINYHDLTFKISPTNFKHTGLFPEQAVNWDYMIDKISKAKRKIKVLNLFAYTGGATIACSSAGADVVHVDSSRGMIEWAKENAVLSNVEKNNIRFLVDDCLKFVQKEIRRGNKYDAIIMDPPSFGRGPKREVWKFEDSISDLVKKCSELLSDNPLFFIVNSYTTGISSIVLANLLTTLMEKNGVVSSGEIALPINESDMLLPCGIYARWESDN